MSLPDHGSEMLAVAGRASPPLAVTGAGLAGLDLSSWVLIATLVYTIIQTLLLIPKIRQAIKDWRNGSK